MNEFNSNKPGSWSLFFDMDKINSLVSNQKDFGLSILSDGVSSSVLFGQQKQEAHEISDEEVIRRYEAGESYYELGIDPRMKTWNASVRRNVFTGEEVTLKKLFVSAFMN